jgi:hypothetical protein
LMILSNNIPKMASLQLVAGLPMHLMMLSPILLVSW